MEHANFAGLDGANSSFGMKVPDRALEHARSIGRKSAS